ncbi:alpha-E domain-containing protein [Pseudomonas sp. NW5]|uniref:alpha-E domain-containing protein n=1 Tax=Pseudomonas sp. NW5 TaxID=2934934 RepID=UPI0020229484|nr:alpha-E domain-containing protein [Pseudomonas sp. NW5]MCL7463223.1 alpha-E domain-containing protein [Pseudomonas sp. NW5]
MLSRTAADIYWMARYLERAENLARMLDVSHSLALMPQDGRGDGLQELAMPLLITGTLDAYLERHGELDAGRLLHFFAVDADNPASIYNCLRAARGNAHAVRGRISADMWESVNATWLEMRGMSADELANNGVSHFCEWLKERVQLFHGATESTLMRANAYRFIRLGTFIERADNTLRLLDARHQLMGRDVPEESPAHVYYEWSALLRALSAFEAYATLYRGSPKMASVAELLLLRAEVPRSLRTCVTVLSQVLVELPSTGRPAQRMAAELEARLRFTSISEVLEAGLEDWITDYIEQLRQLGDAINSAYLETTPEPVA